MYEKREEIETVESADMLSNINKISLKIGLQLLYTAMGKDTYLSLLELFPYLRDDIPTIISVVKIISLYIFLNLLFFQFSTFNPDSFISQEILMMNKNQPAIQLSQAFLYSVILYKNTREKKRDLSDRILI